MKKLFVILILISAACQPAKEKNDLGVLKEEVMAIHDEVMPKMGALISTRKALLAQADSLSLQDSVRSRELAEKAAAIEAANERMMQWMRGYEPGFEGTDEEVRLYLEQQKKAIEEVKLDMERSLARGQQALGERR